jgi:hypothetical protein
MKIIKFCLIILFISPLLALGQNGDNDVKYTLIGTIVNGATNSVLSGANVTINNLGTSTNDLGEFTIKVSANDTITISYVGYKTIEYIAPDKDKGDYLIKFKMYVDSVSLDEVFIFPYPTYQEFREAFLSKDESDKQIEIEGVKTYQDKVIAKKAPSVFSPASFIYDRLFDKKAKTKRKLKRRQNTIIESTQIKE